VTLYTLYHEILGNLYPELLTHFNRLRPRYFPSHSSSDTSSLRSALTAWDHVLHPEITAWKM